MRLCSKNKWCRKPVPATGSTTKYFQHGEKKEKKKAELINKQTLPIRKVDAI